MAGFQHLVRCLGFRVWFRVYEKNIFGTLTQPLNPNGLENALKSVNSRFLGRFLMKFRLVRNPIHIGL